jgi:hypothetical protein
MANENQGSVLIPQSEYVRVKNEAGEVQPDPVPKAWVGTALLPQGWKAASKSEAAKADDGDDSPASDES